MTLKDFAEKNNKDWKDIFTAKEKSFQNKQLISKTILEDDLKPFGNDIDLVIFGSIARDESTSKSDVDWTLLVDGQSDPNHYEIGQKIKQKILKTGLAEPSPSGLFSKITFSHDLIHYIGGVDDTYFNLSKRILLLLESERISFEDSNDPSGTAYSRVILGIIERYISNDSSFLSNHGKDLAVPRFLLNDIVRFWRTMCVDFANKQREQAGKKWALRNIKLRMSRKLIFVKGLLMCASCYNHPSISSQELKATLSKIISFKAIDFVVNELIKYQIDDKWIIQLLDAYDIFLKMLNNDSVRNHIEGLPINDVYSDSLFSEARNNAHLFQEALDNVFYYEETPLKKFTLKYGVF